MPSRLLADVQRGDFRALARAISYAENGVEDYSAQLAGLPPTTTPVVGITGPPGVGKSTLVDALIDHYVKEQKRVAVLCVDPSSTLYYGALLGDRIRMSDWYNHPAVFIRSLATRGSLGGLHPRIIEITDVVRQAPFDQILVETVGVGQNEIEIAGLADTTLVVLAPEAGDDIQSMKAGLLEVADIFVVNKSDRPDADLFIRNLRSMQTAAFRKEGRDIPVVKTVAWQKQGIEDLVRYIDADREKPSAVEKRYRILAEQAYLLIQQQRMKGVDRKSLAATIEELSKDGSFNLYRFVKDFPI
ncbi:methylmalonyl Co-A mutase-associated GTPase MeaB [Puia dinghuensis]|uniref:LAO/AO transport system ATPase n=1 Tax=Puia dinghuensis TaxID=1792502 RepID=A0A8J2UFH3_9BACT|nr:methylmalonyl Co-A mutase-associated GTPase MeaB [Puia dinghuensis]GGB09871.1 LAO/AO transport system ATPase [Puia dinghuensis]